MPKTIDPEKLMTDSKGRLVPVDLVSDVDKARHELVLEIVVKAKALQGAMARFKADAMGDVDAFVELSAEKYGVQMGGRKGNISLTSFDGKYRLQVAVSEHLAFDERLQAAKKLIDECILEWMEDSRSEAQVLINDAFQVDKEGRINTGRILSLRRLAIDDEKWQRAMQAISDSLGVVGSKSYFRVHERDTPDGRWRPVALDLAAL